MRFLTPIEHLAQIAVVHYQHQFVFFALVVDDFMQLNNIGVIQRTCLDHSANFAFSNFHELVTHLHAAPCLGPEVLFGFAQYHLVEHLDCVVFGWVAHENCVLYFV